MRTAGSNQRKAGSQEFTQQIRSSNQPLGMGSDPFADVNRDKQQGKYDAYKARGYNDLNNLETYKAQGQNNRLKEGGRFDTHDAARAGMKSSNFDFGGDLSGYDGGAAGNERFDMQDVKYLQESGASKKAIQKHIRSLGNVHDSIKNSSQFGGGHYRGDMDKTKGIEQFDMGKGFNKWDINYLQKQGYDDKAIADYGINSGLNHGDSTAKFLAGQGRLNTRADNTFDQSANSLPSKMQQKVDAAPIDVKHQYEPPNLETERKRVDEEIDRDYWGEQVNKEAKFNANDTDDEWAENFLRNQLRMHSEAKKTRSTLDLSEFEPDDYLNLNELNKQIDQSIMYDHDQSTLQKLKIYGDQYANASRNPFSWKSPKPPKAFETPDFKSIYKQYKKDIDKI